MLPRLQAEETMRASNLSLATNDRTMNDEQRDAYFHDLEESLGGIKSATEASLDAMGIAVVRTPLRPD